MGFEKLEVGVPAGAVPWGVHRCGRMEERNERGQAPTSRPAGRLRHRGRLRIERSQGMGAERHDQLGVEDRELPVEERAARTSGQREETVPGRPALDDVQDAELPRLQSEPRDRAVEPSTGAAHERFARGVLLGPRGLADEEDPRPRAPPIGHDVPSGQVKRTASAGGDLLVEAVPLRRESRMCRRRSASRRTGGGAERLRDGILPDHDGMLPYRSPPIPIRFRGPCGSCGGRMVWRVGSPDYEPALDGRAFLDGGGSVSAIVK